MSTFVVAAILVGIVVAACLLLTWLDKKQKRRSLTELLQAFHREGTKHNLSFSSQEILKDLILGLDGVHRRILVLERLPDKSFQSFVIVLNEVKNCTVKKEYALVSLVEFRPDKKEQYLDKIVLRFEAPGKPLVDIAFYKHFENHIYEIAELENKAKHWETLLSKIIAPLKKIA